MDSTSLFVRHDYVNLTLNVIQDWRVKKHKGQLNLYFDGSGAIVKVVEVKTITIS